MSTLSGRDIRHIFEQLRKGLVPERGIDTFAVGIEKQRGELHRQLELVENQEGSIKFLRGGYGCGKTFAARLALLDAQARGFATSFVVVSDNDLKFHSFDDVYRKVMTELGTASCARGAFGDILDRWIGALEDRLVAGGLDEEADDFDDRVRAAFESELASLTDGRAPQDFIRVIQAIFDLKQKGEFTEAGALLSWLSGSGNVGAAAKRVAGIKGDIGSRDALDYLRGVLEIVKAAGYKGLVIVIDEVETILRMRKDVRHKSLNGLRQIADASGEYPGLLWIFTGTPDFFDSRHGVAGLAPLHERIRFMKQGRFASVRQPQLELVPFDPARLRQVALQLRELFPTADRAHLEAMVDDPFVDLLVQRVTEGFKGDVGVVPRQFLREFVEVLDNVDTEPDYVPMDNYDFRPQALSDTESRVMRGTPPDLPDDADDEMIPEVAVW
ncbi:MAG: BREX system ATP-binding protein BrxD [Myxococcales bacterium]|nr:BREX system ATP-binding protein BrxD [Myxococcales bacterium]